MESAFWVLAEVMDKQVSISSIWAAAILLGIFGFLACRRYPLASLLVLLVIGSIVYLHLSNIHEPEVARAIEAEAGTSYFLNSYLAVLLVVGFALSGLAVGIHRRASYKKSDT